MFEKLTILDVKGCWEKKMDIHQEKQLSLLMF